MTELIR